MAASSFAQRLNARFGSFAAELFGLRAALCPLLVESDHSTAKIG